MLWYQHIPSLRPCRILPMNRPLLTAASRPLTFEIPAINERGETVTTAIAGEHPLTLYVDKQELVTLMTLGAAPEALTLGYLRNQRLIGALAEVESITVDWEVGAASVKTRHGIDRIEEIGRAHV